jgi:NhaP-type Na+/H+ or K+/H+ antiporter
MVGAVTGEITGWRAWVLGILGGVVLGFSIGWLLVELIRWWRP